MRIGIIGCGNMGGAIATALVDAGKDEVFATDHTKAKVEATGAKYLSLDALLLQSEMLVLAVKPQVIPDLWETLHQASGKRWISLAAGISLETLSAKLGTHEIVRFMPNIAAKAKASVTAVCPDREASMETKEEAMAIALSFGSAFELPEKQMAAFIGISGSGIAYCYEFLHAMALGGTREGIPYQKSMEIARDTLESTVALQKATGKNPIDLMTGVCSAGGTTIEGVAALAENNFDHAVIEAVTASAEKSKRM